MTRVAVIGAGIAGLAAARALAGRCAVEVFEAAPRAGGHVYTVDVATPRGALAVDMGFIVCNDAAYPHFTRLLAELGVATRATSMAFSVSLPGDDLEWGSASLAAAFADRRARISPRHWRFLAEVVGFLRRARRDLGSADVRRASLDEYLATRRASRELRDRFIVPLAAALWSLAPDRCGAFPAEVYLRFLDQHGMLHPVRPPRWRTIVGGSRAYVSALLARLAARVHLATPVSRIERDRRGATVIAGGREHRVDRVVIATHADTALALIDPDDDERRVLGAFRYSANRCVLHGDESFLPRHRTARAAWNVVADTDTSRVAVTYSMNILQGHADDTPLLVTLNPRRAPAHVHHEVALAHPQLDTAALDAQAELPRIGRADRTYYAGAHFGFGFHEDGLRAGLAAAARVLADEGIA
jgi:uncharacterized protein